MNTPSSLPTSEMERLLHDASLPQLPKVGDIVQGTILSISKNEAIVDIDRITTGVVRGRELFDESGEYTDLKVGDEVHATVLELENENGQMELSFRSAGHQKAWDELTRLMNSGEVVEVPAADANRGGLMVLVGRIEGFLPVSQLTPEHYPRVEGGDKSRILELLQKFIGHNLRVKVIDVNEGEGKLIVSEKSAWAKEHAQIVAGYNVGDVVDGAVTGVVDFGAFVEFGQHLEGLIHISELAWQRVENPRDLVKPGDRLKAMIIGIEGTKISLSLKRLKEDPWKKAVEKYQVGQVVTGKVLKLNPFGAFVELDAEIHGLAHISELSKKTVHSPAEVLKAGDSREFKIISIEPEAHRLGLSIKALEEERGLATAEGERVSDPALAGISLEESVPTGAAEENKAQET
ncbi:MAG: S1 RNA-binding domain-containing protein [Candidatus Kerfeldbacteria bacterium]|nr:S1 RNA-binding domain-containing protein [Candidatus Kerfeldbacteria bacterium]